jgi:ketosteroid isomerase-like protein
VHHIGLEVEEASFVHERERLQELGLEIRTGVHPFLSVEAIYVDDPDGNEVELVTAREDGNGEVEADMSASTVETIQRFNAATNRHDIHEMMALMTDDVVFENTVPPDGERREGQDAVRAAWEELFRSTPTASFETEEMFAVGDRCLVRWRYRWADDQPGTPGHIRGADVLRVRAGKIAEKLAYVKG